MPTGIIWSAVPLPCYFNVVKSQKIARLEGSEDQLEGREGYPTGSEGNPGVERWTDKKNFSPFYRTLSPLGAAALLPCNFTTSK